MNAASRNVLADPTTRRLLVVLIGAMALWGLFAAVRAVREDRLRGIEIPRVDTATVDSIVVRVPTDSAVVTRQGSHWQVSDYHRVYAGDSAAVDRLLIALRDTTMWSEQVAATAASHKSLGVDDAGGRHVRIVAAGGKAVIALVVGNRTSDYGGMYVRRPGTDPVYALHASALADALLRDVSEWRSRRIARVTPDSVASVTLTRGGRTSRLERAGAGWTVNGVPADSAAVATLLDTYRTLDAAGFATAAQADSAKLDHPRLAVTLRARGGGSLLTLALDSTAGSVWARADTATTIYRFDPWQVPRLVPADSALRRKAKPSK
jgi:hypothetical protein